MLVLHQQWGDQENYEVVRKVGRGKYSEVFEVRDVTPAAALQLPCSLQQQCAHQPLLQHQSAQQQLSQMKS
jgi:hypothetical protein